MVTNSSVPVASDRAKLTFYNSPKLQQTTAILNKKSQNPLTTLIMALIGSYSKIFVSLQALIKFQLVLIRQVHISLGKNFIFTTEIKKM